MPVHTEYHCDTDAGPGDLVRAAAGAGFVFTSGPRLTGHQRSAFSVARDSDGVLTVQRSSLAPAYSGSGEFEGYGVAVVWRGSIEGSADGVPFGGVGRPHLMQPGQPLTVVADATVSTVLCVATEAVLRAARHASRISPRPLAGRVAERHLVELARYSNHLVSSGAFGYELVRAELTHHLATAVVAALPHLRGRRGRSPAVRASVSRYRAGVRFLEDHASLPVTVADIAQATRGSVAEVEHSFRAHGGTSVHDGLERIRLAAARDGLRAAGPRDATVRDIACRWGFGDLTRFSRAYRHEYREWPETTLARPA